MTALAVLLAALGLAGSAAAEPRLGAGRAVLERELARLKRQARELAEKIRRMEAKLAEDTRARAAAPAKAALDCRPPYYRDSAGIKHIRAECLDAGQPSCEQPFLDERGVRRLHPACITAATRPSGE